MTPITAHRADLRRLSVLLLLLATLTLLPLRSALGANETPTPVPNEPGSLPNSNLDCTDPAAQATAAAFAKLHVPSPEWQDQIIYFVMTDRFADGDPSNNDQGAGEFGAADYNKYNGGDLQGIIDNLDYIQGLGVTALWITPPISNQWWDPQNQFGGYHGYWAENFAKLDPHVGTMQKYQELANALHERGMYLIQDIVGNHTGNFFSYTAEDGSSTWDPADPTKGVRFNPDSVPVTKPSQPPFDQNDVTNPADQDAAIYHWTPTIIDGNDENQQLTYQLSDLDDLNTTNPVVRAALKQAYACWIRNAGVDAFRIDTVKYVEHDFWNDFVYSEDPAAPGMAKAAAATGRDHFFTFGENLVDSQPLDPAGDQLAGTYTGTPDKPELDSVIQYPLFWTIGRVFAEGQPTNYATFSLEQAQDTANYRNPNLNVTFVDNHDQARFLSKGSTEGLKQALLFIMTVPGVPQIYYGTEQGFNETRAAMFASGYAAGGQDHYDTEADLYKYIQALTGLRKANPLFSRGKVTGLADSAAGPGPLAYRVENNGDSRIVLFNTADQPALLTEMDTGLAEGTVLKTVFGLVNQEDIVVGPQGKVTMELPAREGLILEPTEEVRPLAGGDQASITVDDGFATAVLTADTVATGAVSTPDTPVKVIVNGNLGAALDTTADATGVYTVTVPIGIFPPGQTVNSLLAYAPDLMVVSAQVPFTTEVTSTSARNIVYDRIRDDVGPKGVYSEPTDATFDHQMDIFSTEAAAYGTNLQVTLTMSDVTTTWNPRNGFDHVAFSIFIDVPGREGGATVLPMLNANAPEGFAWDYVTFAEGWSNRFTSSQGVTTTAYGQPVTPAPTITSDPEAGTVTFLYSSASLGDPQTLDGARVYVTTWDWNGVDNAFRPLKPVAGQWNFGGGDGTTDPLILDDTDVVEVTAATRQQAFDWLGDDYGPFNPRTASGPYTTPSAAPPGVYDIAAATVVSAADGLEVALQMVTLTNTAIAPNGFDNVRFHVFLDTPDTDGSAVAPSLNLTMPTGFAYDYVVVADGWNNVIASAGGANATALGADTDIPAGLTADPAANTVTMTIPAAAIGNPTDLSAVGVYIAAWGWDPAAGALTALTLDGGSDAFGGRDGATAPLVIDDVLVGAPVDYRSPFPPTPQVDVTWEVTVPDITPEKAKLYLTGPFNNWTPNDEQYQFTKGDDGIFRLTLPFDVGTTLEYRITRGSFGNAEKYDPNDRLANRTLEVASAAPATLTVPIEIAGWWDQ